ncbi:hypothetical protein BTA35_0202980 [Oceanospirillum linum]|uniref:Uncharacterized protein n=1 Tax=Oceanospirillum linum TaxID=966 RepID=A0A1T1HFA5_OCELI|nr:hypothetical protein BTA35_0202980 [Oceanospirillum linum]
MGNKAQTNICESSGMAGLNSAKKSGTNTRRVSFTIASVLPRASIPVICQETYQARFIEDVNVESLPRLYNQTR